LSRATDFGDDGFEKKLKKLYGQMNVVTTLWNFFLFLLFTIIVLLIEQQQHIVLFIANIAEYMISPELPPQIKEDLLYLLQTFSISRSVEELGTILIANLD
jgi:hypothetical protein